MNSICCSASVRRLSASCLASKATQVREAINTIITETSVVTPITRWRDLLRSRRIRRSSPTPNMEAASCVMPKRNPSRVVIFAAKGSRPPSVKAAGKAVEGSPSTITDRTVVSPENSLNMRISSLTHCDACAAGEQITIKQLEFTRAS